MEMPPDAGNAQVRFDVIGRAWGLYQSQLGMWIATSALMLIVGAILSSPNFAIGLASEGGSMFRIDPLGFVVNLVTGTLMLTVSAAVFYAALRQIREGSLRLEALGEITPVLGKVLVAAFIEVLLTSIGYALFIVPGLVVSGLLMFALPLVVDQKLEPLDAIRRSFDMLKSQWLMATLFIVVVTILGFVGLILCGVGAIFTMPFYFLSIALLYDDFVRGAAEG
jgi:uncharacterized membrane protein